jgi:hypothetical protein
MASNTACYAVTIKGYQPLADCCASNVSNCSLARIGEDSLLLCINFNFSSQMPKNEKDYSTAKHSTRTVTPDCESVNPCEKQYDFSKFNEFFTEYNFPDEVIECLGEIRTSYLETSMYVLMDYDGMKPLKMTPHEDIQNHVGLLSALINLIKSIDKKL